MVHLKTSLNQGVLTVSLNRPAKRNAFFPDMIDELTRTFIKCATEKKLRALLLTGEGPSFCAGGDLEWMKSTVDFTMKRNLKDAEALFAMFCAVRNCPVPVIGKAFGHCFGGGAGLIAACDIVTAESATQFCFSEVKWGLVPAVISPFVVERAAPHKVTEWFTSAKVFAAKEAQEGGLIHHCGPMSEVDGYLEQTLHHILNSAPGAVRETKKLLRAHYTLVNWQKIKPKVTQLIARRRISAEGQKGLQAFIDKKTPQWNELPYGQPAKI